MSDNTSKEKNINIGRLTNIVLFLLIIMLTVVLFASTRLGNITVEGVTRYTPEEFCDLIGCDGIYGNTLVFWLKNKLRGKKDIPFVEKYTVTLIDRNTVAVRVYENEVMGCISVMGSFFCFDRNGYITESVSERPESVPCVTGLEYDEAVVFRQLNIKKQSLFEVVMNITKLLRKYDIPVSEINFGVGNEVTLYAPNLKVLLGKNKEYDTRIAVLGAVYTDASEIGGILDLRNYSEENTTLVIKPDPDGSIRQSEKHSTDVEK